MKWLVVAVVAAACGGSPPACPVVPRPAAPSPFLWKVSKPGADAIWLYGTIHNGGEADVPKAAWAALASSSRFFSELGDTEPDPDKTGALARLPPGKGLDQQLPADDWYDLRDALRGVIKEDELRRARPWYALVRLNATVAPSPSPTMDFALAKAARRQGLVVAPLESWEAQLAALADAVKVADLQQAIHARKTMRCELASLLATYRTGDLAAIEARVLIPATTDLVVLRSQAWFPKLEAGATGVGGAFVAVGVAHLAGDRGLPRMFERAGYTVERVR